MKSKIPHFFALLLCTVLTACVYTFPVNRTLVDAANSNDSRPLTLEQAQAIAQIGELYGTIYWAMSVGVPLDQQPMSVRLILFDRIAATAGLSVQMANIQELQSPKAFESLIDETEEALAAQNPRALWLFEYSFHTEVVRSLTDAMEFVEDPEQIANWSRFLGMHMSLATDAAKRLGATTSISTQGNQIAGILLGGLTTSGLATVQAELSDWQEATKNLSYLAADQPTPVPTPTRTGAIGTDITVTLPVGHSERGESLWMEQGCAGCHHVDQPTVAQPISSINSEDGLSMVERAQLVIDAKEYTGSATTVQEYLIEATVLPDIYVPVGYPKGVHPPSYSSTLDAQAMADLIAYIMTFQ